MEDEKEKAAELGIVPGAIVRLKSGGPDMTIESLGTYVGTLKASCVWFIDEHQQSGLFPIPSLKLVSNESTL